LLPSDQEKPNMPLHDYRIIESTLREGEQFVGASFTTDEKVEIARLLDAFGVECIELTSPCASPKSYADMRDHRQAGPQGQDAHPRPLPHRRCPMAIDTLERMEWTS
jgi:homocitrate synthase